MCAAMVSLRRMLMVGYVLAGVLHGKFVQSAAAPTVCDLDLGCGAGCPYACPFGFPCDTPKDCLSGSCTGGYCDTGKSTTSKPSTTGEQSWELTDLTTGTDAFNVVKSSYGETNRKIVKDPAGSGKPVLSVFYPAGSYNPSGKPRGGTGFYAQPINLSNAKVVSFEYQIYFPSGFAFNKGGKLPGLYGGRESCSGGDPALDCFSTRYMFRKQGAGETYLYVDASKQVETFCKVPPLSVCNGDYGNSIGRGSFKFKTGKWQSLLQRITLNTPGHADGRVQVFSDGVEVIDFGQVSYRNTANVGFVGIEFETFFGGSDSSWATPKDQYVYFRGFSLHWE
ncbi:polysaccharide lyase family 14 protein [Spizellomyces punctatus DAOM BR117]|uniref:Polysaccharide lyase family 14 protein n=1 Tax=Spizellomyces punctatus (strain DAOM BR117) TaxID=645134 RepID=A0A0L0HV04_SPIPD|nr:polysaccharide lyase family 14 protein [Spizellomyces punctatus DAOM BR117]KND04922.1 polysaccharide lyase family 14 protein [Spizellomyces punctatus DAOM BR117]|eukprot:XP_016612961.1 polysaccharide lyase family 14 protein [Spizellomyces punctatus DAOM BR117]